MVEQIGYIGLQHSHRPGYFETLAQLPVELTCVCEPDERIDFDRFPATNGLRRYRKPARLLAQEPVDAVVITLSNRDTPAVVEAAIDRGIHVFAEKSLGRTATDVEPLIDNVAGTEVIVGTAYIRRAMPVFSALRARQIDGWFGDLRAFEARFIKNKLRDRLHSATQPTYLYTHADARGGILQWLGCHYLDLIPWILDDPIVRINATTSLGIPEGETEDSAIVHIETGSGVHGTLHCGYYLRSSSSRVGDRAAGPVAPPFQLYGMAGAAVVDPDERTLHLGVDRRITTPDEQISFAEPDLPGYGGAAGHRYLTAFLEECTGSQTDTLATIHDEYRVLRVLDAAYESSKNGQWVSVAT